MKEQKLEIGRRPRRGQVVDVKAEFFTHMDFERSVTVT